MMKAIGKHILISADKHPMWGVFKFPSKSFLILLGRIEIYVDRGVK